MWVLGDPDGDRDLDQDALARLMGAAPDLYLGSGSAHGDLDGDGLDELVLSVYTDPPAAVVVSPPFSGDLPIDPASVPGLEGPVWGLASDGDLDGDGLDDVVVAGSDVAVFAGPFDDLRSVDSAFATVLHHADPDLALRSAVVASDVDGDGADELLVGSPTHLMPDIGGVAGLWYGPPNGARDFVELDARFLGEAAGDEAGAAVLGPGDLDGDGFGDIVIAAPEHDAGVVYRVGGPP